MNWLFWFLASWYALSAVLTVTQIGKPREPISPGMGAAMVTVHLLFVVLLVVGWPS